MQRLGGRRARVVTVMTRDTGALEQRPSVGWGRGSGSGQGADQREREGCRWGREAANEVLLLLF